ncbi:ATPase P [Parolsenella catena]|uniref:ATPase P n=3 Tax=Parolsenella catena TaxID=2003188 RepID=A0A3G9JWL8_9ACTN|nr:ATPase P [Parolsenella catena]
MDENNSAAEARTAETRARVEHAAEVSESAERVADLTGARMRTAEQAARVPDVVVITGMSGSGRTQALHVFEDMGYFCIDNLPPRLILQLAELVGINSGVGRHLAVTCDLRSQGLFDEISDSLTALREHELSCKVVFLDTADEILMRRYDENRRRHPLAQPGESLASTISRERAQLAAVRDASDLVIDTSHMKVRELRRRLRRAFSELTDQQLMEVSVFSFGFKHGMPVEADLMIDVRFLPNPFYDPKMRTLTGNDKLVSDFVLQNPVTEKFLEAWWSLLDVAMPGYVAEGKSHLSIAVGCTGGQHRSVAIANATAAYLERGGYHVSLSHRDLALANVRTS